MATVDWISVDVLTQDVTASLPGMDVAGGMLQRTISKAETATATLNVDGDTPENWNHATRPLSGVLACFDHADPAKAIMWAGAVTSRDLPAHSNQVPLSLVTFEGLFERAYVGDTTYDTTVFATDIVADLFTTWFTPATGIAVELDYTPTTGAHPVVPIINNNTDMNTVGTVLDQVCAQLGLEYTVEWDWAAGGTKLAPRLVFGPRIGQVAVSGRTAVTFSMPGSLVAFTKTEDYSVGAGANRVIGYSSGQGATTPLSDTETVDPDGRPVVEYRYTPAQSVSPAALSQYVQQAIKILGPGAQPVTMSYHTDASQGRRYGTDWRLGDDLSYFLPAAYSDEAGNLVNLWVFPGGLTGIVRSIGVALDLTNSINSPIGADPTIYTGG